jgi:SAM-dependent methyltransferase
MGDEFPSASVVGTDISPTQPSWVPPNVEFQIDDAQLEWTFEPESFDFIHIRYLQGSIADWPRLYGQVFKALKPGGWFQHIEPDLQMLSENPAIEVDKDQYVPGFPMTV